MDSSSVFFLTALFLQLIYTLGVLGLAAYGLNALWLTWQLHKNRQSGPVETPSFSLDHIRQSESSTWPTVTIQLPIYNERYVVERLIDACVSIDYPAEKLQIQLLDDSTDLTTAIAQRRVIHWQQLGKDIQLVHRQNRWGFKAGALADALPLAKGTFIALFDADFKPPSDFLLRTIPHFLKPEGASIGFVQTRWAHLNAEYSALTRSQMLALDGHFVIEQAGRQAANYFFGFNGSAGVWRRACIEDPKVGGWQADTLTEDLDLSYRAQLVGWQPCYLNLIEVKAEIPPQLSAFERQQFRWAKGSVQTLRKLGGRVWRSERPLVTRLSGLLHLGNYLIHPLLLLLLLVMLPLLLLGVNPAWPLAYLSCASIGPPLLYAIAQYRLHPNKWYKNWAYLPVLTLLGTGLSFNNSLAVWQAIRGHEGQFLRTPKFDVTDTSDQWQQNVYRLPLEPRLLGELALFLYAVLTIAVAFFYNKWWSIPFLMLYVGGFGVMTMVGLWQAWRSSSVGTNNQQQETQQSP